MDEVVPEPVNVLSRAVIGAAMAVHSALGPGFLESTYEEALSIELRHLGIEHTRQASVEVSYRGYTVGHQRMDLLVEDCLVLELKAAESLLPVHAAQLRSYLVAMNLQLELLINFNVTHLRNGIKRVANFR